MQQKNLIESAVNYMIQALTELAPCSDEFALGQKNGICDILEIFKDEASFKKFGITDIEKEFNIK